MPADRYVLDIAAGVWRGPRGVVQNITDLFVWPFNMDQPWRRKTGESIYDNIPANVPIVQASNYSTSNDIVVVLQAVQSAINYGCYVQLEAKTYFLNVLQQYDAGVDNYLGFANNRAASRRIMGLIGVEPPVGGELPTIIQASPTMVSSTPGASAYAANPPTKADGVNYDPVSIGAFYFTNTQSTVPLFFSGISFRGTIQTPLVVYGTQVANKSFRRNYTVPSPLPWQGLALWRGTADARMQFCEFKGFGFALNSAPPYEKGPTDTNYGYETYYRCEWDGRISAEIDSSQPRASGGLMINKGQDIKVIDSRMHHTRRSGFATNTNAGGSAGSGVKNYDEKYTARRFRVDHIADPDDGWAGDNGLFNGSNVEGVLGTFNYDAPYFSADATQGHINIATPYSQEGWVLVVPTDRPVYVLRNGFKTDDTIYGGCLRVAVSKTPNSTGISPVWTAIVNKGIDGCGLFDFRNPSGVPLIGVRSTAWNSTMKPDTHFVVTYAN